MVVLVVLGGCGTGDPATFTANPVATGGAHTGSGGRGASTFVSQGGEGGVAGSHQTLESVRVNDDIEAEAAGPGYRFTKWSGDQDLAILAEGDGPAVVVMVYDCEPPRFYSVPTPDDSFEVALIGRLALARPAALVCNKDRCLLEVPAPTTDASLTRSELSPIPASETTPGDWKYLVTRGYADTLQLCLVSSSVTRCFDGNGWLPDEPRSNSGTPGTAAVPICPDLALADYAGRWGVTAEGRVVEIQAGVLGETNCQVRSEPLGAPIALFAPSCGISENLWLLTAQRLDRVYPCECYID